MEDVFWDFRSSLKALEDAKDRIITYWNWQIDMDDPKRTMWIGDAQEVYYQILTAWDLRKQYHGKHDASTQITLSAARSRLEQVASELQSVGDQHARELEHVLRESFEVCWKPLAVESGLLELMAQKEMQAPAFPVFKISKDEYHLPCAICSALAYVFKIDTPYHVRGKRLVYRGLTHSGDVDIHHTRLIFKFLDAGDIAAAHNFLIANATPEGIDAYCPDCDKIFCRGHFWLEEKWDEGFYDCTYGICPKNHRRIVND